MRVRDKNGRQDELVHISKSEVEALAREFVRQAIEDMTDVPKEVRDKLVAEIGKVVKTTVECIGKETTEAIIRGEYEPSPDPADPDGPIGLLSMWNDGEKNE